MPHVVLLAAAASSFVASAAIVLFTLLFIIPNAYVLTAFSSAVILLRDLLPRVTVKANKLILLDMASFDCNSQAF